MARWLHCTFMIKVLYWDTLMLVVVNGVASGPFLVMRG
jgi:hypothetical protein